MSAKVFSLIILILKSLKCVVGLKYISAAFPPGGLVWYDLIFIYLEHKIKSYIQALARTISKFEKGEKEAEILSSPAPTISNQCTGC